MAAFYAQVYAALCFVSALVAIRFLDRLTNILLVLSTFLLLIVCQYSKRYMAGDPGRSKFALWLCLTGTCVFGLVLSQNLLVFTLAWCGTSLGLHQLLRFYKDRPGALLAARKKFLISRVGDAALVGALVLTHNEFGTWDFKNMFLAAAHLQAAGPENLPHSVTWIAVILVFAALLKSAQFPFHTWLPDSMETPTPVSALMHAGIINAGGILVIRLSPLIALSDAALTILCVVGSFTALFASSVMLTQASVKRCFAFSTVAQMGFMMLECGLGALHLALLHLVAHSLYKAHAFLSSGGAVLNKPRKEYRSAGVWAVGASLLSAAGIVISTAALFRVSILDEPAPLGIFTLALAQMLWNFWNALDGIWRIPFSLALGLGATGVYFELGRIAQGAVQPIRGPMSSIGLAILAVFALVALAQSRLSLLAHTDLGRHLYVHARNGFYFNTLANRMMAAIWPVKVSQVNI